MRPLPRTTPAARCAGVGLAIAVLSTALHAGAQPTDGGRQDGKADPQAEARAAMREGLAAADLADHETALRSFRRAMELVPQANLPHRHAARSLEELGRWDEAVAEYETYLRIKADVSDAQAVRDRIAEIKKTRLVGKLSLACEPAPSDVEVDGSAVTLGPARELELPKGPHRIRVSAPGHVPRELDVVVPGGGRVAPACVLEKVAAAPAPSAATRRSPPHEDAGPPTAPSPYFAADPGARKEDARPTPWYGRWYTWAGAGAVVAGAVVATVLIAGSGGNPPPSTEGGNFRFP